jgi:hydroxymethylpyrimidine pyrophosphatase-like HAD family hydrolase
MLCSHCSEEVKPIVAIDIDGTLGDYHAHFIDYARKTYLGIATGSRYGMYDGTEPFREWCERTMRVDATQFRAIKLAYRQGGLKRSMPVYEGAIELVAGLREAGAEIWLTTTRPYLRLDNVDPDTRFWLDRHAIVFDGMLYDEDKYAVLAQRVDRERVVAVLDDLPEQYDAARHEFGGHVPILRCNDYNRNVQRERVALTLTMAANFIKASIDDWRAAHA